MRNIVARIFHDHVVPELGTISAAHANLRGQGDAILTTELTRAQAPRLGVRTRRLSCARRSAEAMVSRSSGLGRKAWELLRLSHNRTSEPKPA